jgi:hypothetical protein
VSEYDLDSLGWFQFERLCQSLLKSRCGLDVEAWGRNGDWGRDAYAEGPLRFPADEENDGPFIFQVKFVKAANAAGADPLPALIAGVHRELRRIAEREESGEWELPRYYVLLTNTPLDAAERDKVREILQAGLPESQIVIEDSADLDSLLDDSPRVRLAFPQVLGLRDIFALLDQRVNKDILKRSSLALDISKEHAGSFVATEAYSKALNVLSAKHFVVLTGPPEMGKTTIAWMVALARLSGDWEAFECRTPEDFFRAHEEDRAQVFVVDDAFGSTEYRPDRATLWADDLEKVLRALDYRHWLLLTSRPAPLKTALERLNLEGAGGENFPLPNEVLVDASELSVQEKAQMLYRHAKSAVEEERGRLLIRAVARELVNHEHFTPLRIKRFVTNQVPAILAEPEDKQSELMQEAVGTNLEQVTREMATSFGNLPEDCKVLLISMLDANGTVVDEATLAPTFERHLGRAPERSATATAEMIEDHFLRIVHWSNPAGKREELYVEWVHPSVRDLVIDHLMNDPAARREFLAKAGIDGMMLALSSEGGAEGKRLFPLLVTKEDWEEIEKRIAALPASASAAESSRLAALLANIARLTSEPAAAEHKLELETITSAGLKALSAHWSGSREIRGNGELRNFYLASVQFMPPVQGPDLSVTWAAKVAAVEALQDDDGDIEPLVDAANDLFVLVSLLRRYEPRWLIGLDFPNDYRDLLELVTARIERAQDELETPWIEEEENPSEYTEPPPNLEWIENADYAVTFLRGLDPELAERLEQLPSQMEEKSSEWQDYAERHEAYAERELDENGFGGRYREEAEIFDLVEFFSDL